MTLPTFVIIGAAKSGTTSLAVNLADHPQVFVAPGEVHFFSDPENWSRGQAWYESQFASAGAARAIGEKSPSYLYDPRSATRMAETFPLEADLVFVVILREPIARAVSHVEHRRRRGVEVRGAEDAIRQNLRDPDAGYDYLDRGRYEPQLRRFIDVFGPDALHVEFYDDLRVDPDAVYTRLCNRLSISPFVPPRASEPVNHSVRLRHPFAYRALLRARAGHWLPARTGRWLWDRLLEPADYASLSTELRRELAAEFQTSNVALAALLGRPLPPAWGDPLATA